MTKEIIIPWKDEVFTVLVDDDSYTLLNRHTWYIMFSGVDRNPYAFTEVYSKTQGKRMVYMHQIVLGAFCQTDHIDLNTLNNQFLNLREATYQENGWNKGKQTSRKKQCTSIYKGVSYCPLRGKPRWKVQLRHVEHGQHKSTGKYVCVGYFYDEVEAAKAYNKRIVQLRGDLAWLNPIPEINQHA